MAAKPLSASTIGDICSNIMEDYSSEHNVAYGLVRETPDDDAQWAPLDAGHRSALRAMAEMKRQMIAAALGKEGAR